MAKAAEAPKRPTEALVKAHEAHSSIRAQSKRAAALPATGVAGVNKEVIKAVLASPLIIPWPTLPTHLQNTVLRTLATMIPTSVAEYHVSRERCHRSHKRKTRRQIRAGAREGVADSVETSTKITLAEPVKPIKAASEVPTKGPTDLKGTTEDAVHSVVVSKPDELTELTIGINEVIKHLEAQTSALRLRIQAMVPESLAPKPNHLLPTAPVREPSPESDDNDLSPKTSNPFGPRSSHRAPLRFIICALPDINPPTLVSPLPQYCATYNALVRQWTNVAKSSSGPNDTPQEITLVPTARGSEMVIAEMMGLRRVACFGMATSYPNLTDSLVRLLPPGVLVPPRHTFALPSPVPGSAKAPAAYIPLHLKAVHTTVPANAKERKAVRLAAVREKRKARDSSGGVGKKPKA